MGETISNDSIFKENYNGILTHKGTVMVAKTEITAKILNITKNTVLVRGKKQKGYICEIHKDLHPLMNYVEKGDTAFIKWKNGKPYFVGFKKNPKKSIKSDNDEELKSGETDWLSFFNTMEME